MKHISKVKRKMFPKTPKQPIPSESPAEASAWPSSFQPEQNSGPKGRSNLSRQDLDSDLSMLLDEEAGMDSKIALQSRAEEDQELPVSEAGTPGIVLDAPEDGKDPIAKNPGDTKGGEIGPAESSRVAKTAREGTSFEGATVHGAADEDVQKFSALKAVLDVVSADCADCDDDVAVGQKARGLLPRIVALEEGFDSPPRDVEELRRRDEVIRELGRLGGQLRSLAEKPGPRIGEISKVLEGLRETIFDYQKVQQDVISSQRRGEISPAEAAILNNFHSAQRAEYRHGNRKGCLKGTREAILDGIELWANDSDQSPVYWLNGLAGTGKTTIAQTISERMFASGQLGASFFCSRDFEDRSNLEFIFPTLAIQLARKYPQFRSIFVPMVQQDPGIAHESLYNQMDKLIVGPLKKSSISTVIVVDALDECKDEEPASAILSVLGRFVSEIPKAKFFLTGRPEPRIRTGFRLPLLAEVTDVFFLHKVEPRLINSDIQQFLRHSFVEIANGQCGLDGWPTEEDVDHLCKQAGGLFVYAVATIRFIGHRNIGPRRQLERLLQSPESTKYQGKSKINPKTTLDSLYISILEGGFCDDDPEYDSSIRSVLGAIVLAANPLSPSSIATLLGFHSSDVSHQLTSVHSLILQGDNDHPVQPFHKSFPDFITDPTRCTNQRFYVFPPHHHHELVKGCLELMNQTLEKNMCQLPNAITNSEVGDLKDRIKKYITPALEYACRSWYKHLIINEHTVYPATINSAIEHFLRNKFLFWLEVLSVLGAAREAVDALRAVKKWFEASPTLDIVNDCFQFVTTFFGVISTSAPHIYHSAVPLSPRTSIMWKLYEPYANPLVRLVYGIPTSWDLDATTFKHASYICATAWSPCSRFIAVAIKSSGGIQILDAVTLEQLLTTSPLSQPLSFGHLLFSPSGHLLTYCMQKERKSYIVSWDLQTGGLICNLEIYPGEKSYESMTYSGCGTMVGTLFTDIDASIICICNILTSKNIASYLFKDGATDIWTHGEYLRFSTLGDQGITIWEAVFDLANPATAVQSLSTPSNIDPSALALFDHTLLYLAFYSHNGHLQVWDIQNNKLLLESAARFLSSFSSDGHFFAHTNNSGVQIWKQFPSGYTHLQTLPVKGSYGSHGLLQFSPNGKFLLVQCSLDAFQLFPTGVYVTPLSDLPAQNLYQETEPFILEFSSAHTLAAAIRMRGKVVTVIDLSCGLPQLIIDMDTEVYATRIIENTAFIFSNGKASAWNIPIRGGGGDHRADVSGSMFTTSLKVSDRPKYTRWWDDSSTIAASISPDAHHIAVLGNHRLDTYDMATGNHLYHNQLWSSPPVCFIPDGNESWYLSTRERVERMAIDKDGKPCLIEVDKQSTDDLPGRYPWKSTHGYKVTGDGWILSPSGKQLLWLPYHWQLDEETRKWDGCYLALLHNGLPEPVILDLQPEELLVD
ncbi:hypothetical protein BJ322DRAFT_1148662 [Thelephora terrestris]|uniref:NACHT domain-containing protein n=1 Tax=Thelephora terrestris TaxID=56493 RepID=A0A9P6HP59_9AGAM|nr:hypothetical protein BJ322DRAFT_1148662 [Thelephora terrestris]